MDPDAALEELRDLKTSVLDDVNGADNADARRLAELIDGLDHWLSTGGFLPGAWANGGPRR